MNLPTHLSLAHTHVNLIYVHSNHTSTHLYQKTIFSISPPSSSLYPLQIHTYIQLSRNQNGFAYRAIRGNFLNCTTSSAYVLLEITSFSLQYLIPKNTHTNTHIQIPLYNFTLSLRLSPFRAYTRPVAPFYQKTKKICIYRKYRITYSIVKICSFFSPLSSRRTMSRVINTFSTLG